MKMSRRLQRLNVNLPVNLIQEIDEYAKRKNLNRTSAVTLLISSALEQKDAIDIMGELLNKLSELEEKSEDQA